MTKEVEQNFLTAIKELLDKPENTEIKEKLVFLQGSVYTDLHELMVAKPGKASKLNPEDAYARGVAAGKFMMMCEILLGHHMEENLVKES